MTWHVSPEEWLLDFTSVPRGRPRAESLDAIDDRLRLMLAPPAPQPALIMPSITGAGRQPPRPPAPPPARASAPEPGRVREPSRPVPEARSAEPEAARPETALIMPNLSSEPRPEPGPSVLDVQIVSLTATPAPTIPPPVNAADLVIPTLTRSGFDLDVDDDEASALDRLDPVSGPELGIPADDADDLMSAMAASTPMLTSPPTPAPTRPEEVLEEPEEVEEHELEAEPLEEHEPAAEEVEERAPEKRAPAAPERPTSAPEKRAPERPLTAEKPPEKAPERPPTQPERAAPVLDKPTPPRPPPVADKPVPPPPPTEKAAAPAAEKAAPPPPPAADKPTPPPPPAADRPRDKPAPPPPPGEKAGPPSPPKPATVPPPLAKPPAPASKPAAAPVAAPPVAAAAAAAAAQAGRKRNWFDEAFGDHYGSITPLDADASAELDAAFIRKTAELGAGQSLLDVACGDGRHCFALANLGLMVSGLDCSLAQLVRASQRNEATEAGVTLLHGDMRSLPRDRQYDIVTCLGSSLGYFESDDQNRQCIQELVEVLRPGGKLVLHTFNRDYLVAVLPCRSWWQGRGCLVLDVADMNYFTNRVRIHRTVVFEDGRQFEHHMYIRMFSLHELGKILTSLGMRVLEVSGSRDTRGRFYGATSAEIWIVAQRRDDV